MLEGEFSNIENTILAHTTFPTFEFNFDDEQDRDMLESLDFYLEGFKGEFNKNIKDEIINDLSTTILRHTFSRMAFKRLSKEELNSKGVRR